MTACLECNAPLSLSEKQQRFLAQNDYPEPSLCVQCREQRRTAWRNERTLYKRNCKLCGRNHVSIYSPDKQLNVLCQKCWWGDNWDRLAHGRDFDFNRPFFAQFAELLQEAGLISLFTSRNENSEFVNQETDDKNCYLNAGGHYNEDCYYCTYSIYGKNNVDCYWVLHCELCYNSIHCSHCYNGYYLKNCVTCENCYFCEECTGCKNCFGCFGLKHKEYHYFNEPLSKEEYEEKVSEVRGSYQKFQSTDQYVRDYFLKFPHKSSEILKCINSTGDYLKECKNCKNSYVLEKSEDCENVFIGLEVKNGYDLTSFGWGEKIYEVASSLQSHSCGFCSSIINLHDSHYCFVCQNAEDLFGCIGLNRAKYCILNKQYSKAEYFEMRDRIIAHMKKTGEWGQFFPISLSPFGYNETVAHEYFPLTKVEVNERGWNWKEDDPKEFQKQTYEIPDNINEVKNDILNETLACQETGRNFRITQQELRFYRQQQAPIPRLHPQIRHVKRLEWQNPRHLWQRSCDKCGRDVKTTFALKRPEKVYCEQCYLNEVY